MSVNNLTTLPEDTLNLIMWFTSEEDVRNLAQVCKVINKIIWNPKGDSGVILKGNHKEHIEKFCAEKIVTNLMKNLYYDDNNERTLNFSLYSQEALTSIKKESLIKSKILLEYIWGKLDQNDQDFKTLEAKVISPIKNIIANKIV